MPTLGLVRSSDYPEKERTLLQQKSTPIKTAYILLATNGKVTGGRRLIGDPVNRLVGGHI
jgi:hypothetical protein